MANLAIGPFLLLYGTVLIQGSSLQKKDGWHFLPAALYVLFSPVIPNQLGDTLWYVSYSFVILQQLGYIGWSALFIRDWTSNWAIVTHRGFIILWTTVALIWLTYLLIFLGLIPVYLFGALAYSFLVLLLFYFVTKEGQALLPREKYVQQPLSNQESAQYLAMIRNKMETDKSYLNPDLTIQQLSQELKLPAKLISRVINEQLRLNFSAFINSYRIEEAKRRLKSAAYRPYTIASIAYDCGFNSISSFNTTFKVMTQQTPSQFRKAFLHPSV
ncbi:MAG: AraC family transcriptional regulator [Bacteroidota bacterium]